LNFPKSPPNLQRIIGLTGNISTGKSTVAKYLAQHHHLPVFDADIYARQAVVPGSDGLQAICQRYGPGILLADGTLDRSQLAEIIFSKPKEKLWLESIIHPYVRECFARDMAATPAPVVVAVIPLLFETQLQGMVTEVWVVACELKQQITRLQERDRLTAQQALTRIASQMPLATKIKLADAVLDNSGSEEDLLAQIDQLLQA
jgi:dephospho-CoA kinase